MLVYKQFSFDSAHYLTHVPKGHKCAEMHGHTYILKIWLEGEINDIGWVMDFAEIKTITKSVIHVVDHKCLNNIEGLSNPTAENIAVWFWDKLKPLMPQLCKIELQETPTSGVVYYGK